jgi:uncharacterized protein DUF4340
MKANRIVVGLIVLVVLGIAAFVMTRPPKVEEFKSPLHAIDKSKIDRIEIHRPGEDGDETALAKRGDAWRVAAPVDAVADGRAVENALTKIGELTLMDEASRSKDVHESLGVDEAHALHLVAKEGNATRLDLLVGALRGGFTMVRIPGNDTTYRVSGSILQVFNKATKDWRDKVIFDTQGEDFDRLEFQSPNGHWIFQRGEGDWSIAEGPPIPNYDFHKVSSIVTSLAKLRTMDFEDHKSPADAGIRDDSPFVRFTLKNNGGTFRLRIGNSVPYNSTERFFVARDGSDQIYVISKYLADRFRPTPDRFAASATHARHDAGPTKDAGPAHRGDGGSAELPPEVMRQVQQELEKQKRMKALMEKSGGQ